MAHLRICKFCQKMIDYNAVCQCETENKRKRNNENVKRYARQNKDEIKFFSSKRWKDKRQEILSRDNFRCQRCYILHGKIHSSELQVHHIKSRKNFPELRFESDNLIALCKTCNIQLGTNDKLDFVPVGLNDEYEFKL